MSRDPGPDVVPSGHLGVDRSFSHEEIDAARDVFLHAWDKRWFRPTSWVRSQIGTAIGAPTDTIKTRHVVVLAYSERQSVQAAKIARKSIPHVPVRIVQISDGTLV